MDALFSIQRLSMYQVAVVSLPSGTVAHSMRKLSIATQEEPARVCGQAFRVGYTGSKKTYLALYRLKVKPSPELRAIIPTDLFVLEQGFFHVYTR